MAGTVAKMIWGNPAPVTPTAPVSGATPPATTPNAATVTAGTSDLFTFGLPTGYTQKDLGDGRYEMFDPTGKSAGYNYKGVRDAISDLSYRNANAKTTNTNGVWSNPYLQVAKSFWTDVNGQNIDISGLQKEQISNDYGPMDAYFKVNEDGTREQVFVGQTDRMVNQEFSSEDEIKKALERYKTVGNYNGVMGDWEALGQVLEGNVAPNPQEWGNLPTDQKEQIIKGTGMLYGSTPVFSKDGQLIGYRTDITPNNDAKDFSNGTDRAVQKDFGTFITHGGKSHSWNNANWRELSDPDAWKNNAVVGEGGIAFIPVGSEDKLSWTNKDSYKHQDTKANWGFSAVMGDIAKYTDPIFYKSVGGEKFYDTAGQEGIYAAVFDRLDPILDKIDPAHNKTQDAIKGLIGANSQRDAFQKIAPIMVAIFAPYGGYINAANSAQQGDYGAALMSVAGELLKGTDFGSAAAKAGASESIVAAAKAIVSGDISQMTGGLVNLGGTANKIVGNAVLSAGKNAIAAGLSGADLEDALKVALTSAITSLVGGAASVGAKEATSGILGQSGSNIAGNVAGTVAGNLTGGAVNGALTDKPTTPAPGGSTTRPTRPTTPTTTPTQSTGAGRVARMIWS